LFLAILLLGFPSKFPVIHIQSVVCERQLKLSFLDTFALVLETMSSSPSFDSIMISTFLPPRTAPQPRVIPLYATTIPHRGHCVLSMHQNLRPKALYQPYTQEKRNKPAPIDVSSSSSCNPAPSTPGSPLTPVDDELPDGRSGRIRTILIPPPNTKVTVANSGWPEEVLPNYRVCGRFDFPLVSTDKCIRKLRGPQLNYIWILAILSPNKLLLL